MFYIHELRVCVVILHSTCLPLACLLASKNVTIKTAFYQIPLSLCTRSSTYILVGRKLLPNGALLLLYSNFQNVIGMWYFIGHGLFTIWFIMVFYALDRNFLLL